MALKLDMSKAYDRVEWPFLQSVLQKMGFPPSWVSLIMSCVTTVRFSIMLNGNPQPRFVPFRGLRQGDPLSPYLFIMCGKVFSALIEKSIASRMLHGIKVANRASVISHLLFADDSIIFARANSQEAECVLDVLSTYEKASGQVINLDKSMFSVSRNVPQNGLDELKQLLNVKAVESFDKYLGLPTMIGKSKTQIFNFVIDRVWKKLKGWKESTLSRAGREVLIKSVVQAIPSYVMSCFILPDSVCADIERMVSRFYWGGDVEKRGLHWASWHKLTRSKFDGGLGFRDFKSFNIALVAKNWWRIFSHPETLLAPEIYIFKGVYFPHGDLLGAKLGYRPSYAWSSIIKSNWIFHEGGLWRIGDGSKVDILHDKWLPNGAPVICRQDLMAELGVSKVTHLIDHASNSWKHDLVDFIFHPATVSIILQIPLPLHGGIDTLMWPETVDGNYCSKSGYVFVRRKVLGACSSTSSQSSLSAPLWKKFWRIDAQPRCKEVAWRGVWSLSFWFGSPLSLRLNRFGNMEEFLADFLPAADDDALTVWQAGVYALWEARNRVVFQGGEVPVPVAVVVQRCCMLAAAPVVDAAVVPRPSPTLPSS
ncbi:uncharacterized protein LOC130725479 [Lotus japonicus]|uniref:uncharacterized protein LOC130725479 n=1 Tax=Lotus japonicus TaxID=34305 RepID=UPI00258EE751|nr:uncharacterized protein LOC130725479 [Lotus japonicus]